MSAPSSVTVVGASLAGLRAAETLRRDGFDGPITLIGDEAHEPYDRPPLSKQVLAGDWEPDRIALTPSDKLADLDLDLRLGAAAAGFDLASRTLRLTGGHTGAETGGHPGAETGGETLEVDALLIATGARCRTLGEPREGVHVLRSLDDCLALRADFDAAPDRVVVVGAGFIGAEVAATARTRGLDVTVVEALPAPLIRVLGPEMGEVCAAVHRDHGVDLRTGVGVEGFDGAGVEGFDGAGRVERVRLTDGSAVDASVVVVGIGVVPNTEWLEGSGLALDDGVVCDAAGLAAPGVAAAGDVARWPNRRFGEVMRVEHWDNAAAQGAHSARALLGAAEPYEPVPWFWSDQYDRKIQLAGHVRPDDEVRVVAGSVAERRFAALYGRGGKLMGALGFNRPRHVMRYRAMIEQGAAFEEALAAEV